MKFAGWRKNAAVKRIHETFLRYSLIFTKQRLRGTELLRSLCLVLGQFCFFFIKMGLQKICKPISSIMSSLSPGTGAKLRFLAWLGRKAPGSSFLLAILYHGASGGFAINFLPARGRSDSTPAGRKPRCRTQTARWQPLLLLHRSGRTDFRWSRNKAASASHLLRLS